MSSVNTLKLNALPDYIQEHRDELFIKATLGSKTLGYVEIMPNVKYKDALNYLDSEVVLQDGSICGWNRGTSRPRPSRSRRNSAGRTSRRNT